MFGKKKSETSGMTPDQVYSLIKSAFDNADLKYGEDADRKIIHTGFMGDDLPIRMNIIVEKLAIRILCQLDFKSSPDNYSKVAWELNCINKTLSFGAFYLDPDDGYVMFEDAFPYREAQISEGFIIAFCKMMADTVDSHDGDLKKIAESVPRSRSNEPMFG